MEKLSECDFTPRNLEPNVLAIVKKKKNTRETKLAI